MARDSDQCVHCEVGHESVSFRFEEGVTKVDLESVRRSTVVGEVVDLEGAGSPSGGEVKLFVPTRVVRAWLMCISLITDLCGLEEALEGVSADALVEYLKVR